MLTQYKQYKTNTKFTVLIVVGEKYNAGVIKIAQGNI